MTRPAAPDLPPDPLLEPVERCYDAIPRPFASTEEVGPFTLFRARPGTGWPLYARPRLALDRPVAADDVRRVLRRQRELGLPQAVEWVDGVTPTLLPAVRELLEENGPAGAALQLELCPLLALPAEAPLPAADSRVRVLAADDPDLSLAGGAVSAAFAGHDEVVPRDVGVRATLVEQGLLVVVAAHDAEGGLVGAGSAAPRDGAAELMGIGVLPRARCRGLGAAITATLAAACRDRGTRTLFLTAASDGAAGVYRSVGFERRGLAGILGEAR